MRRKSIFSTEPSGQTREKIRLCAQPLALPPDNTRMLSIARRFRSLLTGLALVLLAAPAAASDSMLDLVHELAAQPPAAAATFVAPARAKRCSSSRARAGEARGKATCQVKAGKVSKAKDAKSRKVHRRAKRRLRRSERLKLNAAARGSGRIDVIDMSGPVSFDDRPAIATKSGL
jgi:hypothetical protein